MPQARIGGVIIEEMVEGEEVIVGVTCDPQFGPFITFGLGGLYVEVLKDVSHRLAPITVAEAKQMISEVKIIPDSAGSARQKSPRYQRGGRYDRAGQPNQPGLRRNPRDRDQPADGSGKWVHCGGRTRSDKRETVVLTKKLERWITWNQVRCADTCCKFSI